VIVARIYDGPEPSRRRVLIDRLWPRGVARADAPIDEWRREVAPSGALRKWYGHDPARFAEFTRRYRAELDQPPQSDSLAELRELSRTQPLVLVTATKDVAHSSATVLAELLRES
jgi:uncharacterized protein YeaO (DUF488 family)